MPQEEYLGEEYLGAVGSAVAQALQKVRPQMMRTVSQSGQPFARPPLPATPTQPATSSLRSHVGFGSASWAIADGTGKSTVMEPQESFRVERLIIDTNLTGVTNAVIIQLQQASVGTQPQSPSVEFAAPAAMFARDSTYANVDWQVAYRGVKVQLLLAITAAPAGAAAVASIGAFGTWVR